ncbi:MAG: hypothetical protein A3G87_04400 [Omnitrophica bacterium RIFCSPLOWO2_12_FULL_50_11]|nr:MAG: hypothetical protein A3G87_04400 [Omnitrophica bacterium RIFCSPLOWO2_12_FULL_50_11]
MDANKILAVTDARKELYALIKDCEAHAATFVLTAKGKAVARLVSEEEYESLMETLEILSDRPQVERLARALKHLKRGKLYPHEKVFGHRQPKS